MKAMILAAGYGTRLRPLTFLAPKPVFPVCNKPIVSYAVDNLIRAGADEIVVNLHHLPDAVESLLTSTFDCRFHFSLEHEILGTGGGLRRVAPLFRDEDDFLLVNGDTIQVPPYESLLAARRDRNAVAALVLRRPPTRDRFTPVWYEDGRVTGFGAGWGEPLMFAGAHAISGQLFERMPAREEFGIVESVYQQLAAEGRLAAIVDDGFWFDVGTPERYLSANAALRGDGSVIAETAVHGTNVTRSVVGEDCIIRGRVTNSVLWSGCRISDDSSLTNCIVADDVEVDGLELDRAIVCRDDLTIPRDGGYEFRNGMVIARFGEIAP